MSHPIVHWELMGPDGTALKSFYEDLFGWKPEAYPGFDSYYGVSADDAGVGGAIGQGSAEMPSYGMVYIQVASIDEHLAKITASGGSTVAPRSVIPGVVAFAQFSDPAGNLVGLVEEDVPAAE
jgi:hypothetical protein